MRPLRFIHHHYNLRKRRFDILNARFFFAMRYLPTFKTIGVYHETF